MLVNDPPSYSDPPTFDVKTATSFSSTQAIQEIDDESVFVENEIFESQPRILFEGGDGLERSVVDIEKIPEETKDEKSSHSRSRKSLQCCSKHFGLIPIISTTALIINIVFLILVALLLIVPSKVAETVQTKELLVSRSSVKASFVYLRDIYDMTAYNTTLSTFDYAGGCGILQMVLYYYNYTVYQMLPHLPKNYHFEYMPNGPKDVQSFFSLYKDWQDMANLYCNLIGYSYNYTRDAAFYRVFNQYYANYYNETYQNKMKTFENRFFGFMEEIYTVCNSIDNFTIGSGIAVLVCACLACVIVIPVGILNYVVLGRQIIRNEKKCRIESTNILKDTMADPGMREEFKMFCKNAKVEVPFSILEKVQYFKEVCKESTDCQFKLFEITKEIVVEKSLAKKADIYIQQVSNELEKKMFHLERHKSEIIFEIITSVHSENAFLNSMNWLIQQIDLYNNREGSYEIVDILHSKILDNLEKEISDILSLTHFQFKSTHGLNMNTSPNSPQSPTIDLSLI